MPISQFTTGQLVRARDRDWVVLPSDTPELLRLRPVDGYNEPPTGIFLPLEAGAVGEATYEPPDPTSAGNFVGGTLLADALRMGLRSGAGPFRSAANIQVRPRAYQYVPLVMALRLDPVRMLIADDVGIGKTIEAAMIARELLDRGSIRRVGVLCPAHLCDQWEGELREKFGIEATVVQPSEMARLERGIPRGDINVFQHYPHLVASIDFVKSDRYRGTFLDNAPDFLIIDEAHGAARPGGASSSGQQQRHALVRQLANDQKRHVVLVTATPHSGIDESFQSLLGLIDRRFDSDGTTRKELLPHVVQRRRSDLQVWEGSNLIFPERDTSERQYVMSDEYNQLFEDVLEYCRESIQMPGEDRRRQRVRYWAALSLLRCVLSSPASARTVLQRRSAAEAEQVHDAVTDDSGEDVDARFEPEVLDRVGDESSPDFAPSAPEEADNFISSSDRARLRRFHERAAKLEGSAHDAKLNALVEELESMISKGLRPIVFCRFIATANYVEEQAQKRLTKRWKDLVAVAVTGEIGDQQRRERINDLVQNERRVLVATDCLSEGINLQEHFNAVVHYDLPWNPNRLEQREGRVDRFGQRSPKVRAVMLHSPTNVVDQSVLDVLLRKAKEIKQRLGISVSIPVESEQVVQALIQSVLFRGRDRAQQLSLALVDPSVQEFQREMDHAAERHENERAFFAQHQVQPAEIVRVLEELQPALGDQSAVQRFVHNALQRFDGNLRQDKREGVFDLLPGDLRASIRARIGIDSETVTVSFTDPVPEGTVRLVRNHPIVATIADAVIAEALKRDPNPDFARSSAVFTNSVDRRTAVVVMRLRYLLTEGAAEQFAEEVVVPAFVRKSGEPAFFDPLPHAGLALLSGATPTANMAAPEKHQHIEWALAMLDEVAFDRIIDARVAALQESHARLREQIKAKPLKVQPHRPPDVMGVYVLVPGGGS